MHHDPDFIILNFNADPKILVSSDSNGQTPRYIDFEAKFNAFELVSNARTIESWILSSEIQRRIQKIGYRRIRIYKPPR